MVCLGFYLKIVFNKGTRQFKKRLNRVNYRVMECSFIISDSEVYYHFL